MQINNNTPIVLSFNLHDPTGRIGIQSDVETIASLGGHGVSVITDLCAQDTQERIDHRDTDLSMLIEQARAILEDLPVSSTMIGHCANLEQVEAIHTLLRDYPTLPVALDLNMLFANPKIKFKAVKQLLVPLCDFGIIDHHTLSLATNHPDCDATMASQLIAGSEMQLLVVNHDSKFQHPKLYSSHHKPVEVTLPEQTPANNSFACITAAAATVMGHGMHIDEAIHGAIKYSLGAAHASRQLGMGQTIPNRLFWTNTENGEASGTN